MEILNSEPYLQQLILIHAVTRNQHRKECAEYRYIKRRRLPEPTRSESHKQGRDDRSLKSAVHVCRLSRPRDCSGNAIVRLANWAVVLPPSHGRHNGERVLRSRRW